MPPLLKKLSRSIRTRLGRGQPRFLRDFDRNLGFDLEEDANRFIKIVRTNTMLPYERLVSLYQQVVFCERNAVPGSFVECGVWKGGAVGLMALANLHVSDERRHLHLFDAFGEICQPDDEVDGELAIRQVKNVIDDSVETKGKLEPLKGIYDRQGGPGTVEDNRHLIESVVGYDGAYVHYHAGWFQDTLPRDAGQLGEIAILRLDGDWYASIKTCLEHLYPLVVPGGFIVIDDYGYYEGCTRAVDEYREQHGIRDFVHHIDHGSRYWIKT